MNVTTLNLNPVATCTETIHQLGVFEAIFFSVLIFIAAILMHELGHYLSARSKGFKPKIIIEDMKITTEFEVDKISKSDEKEILLSGILLGMVPIMFASFIHVYYLLPMAAYIMGCQSDYKKLRRLK